MARASLLVLLCLVPSLLQAGPWTKKAGRGFVQFGFSTIPYNKLYDDAARKKPLGGKANSSVAQLFADVGATDDLSVSVAIPVVFITVKELQGVASGSPNEFSNSGLGDIDFSLKYNLFNRNSWAISGLAVFGLPTGDNSDPNGLILGDGEFNMRFGLSVGHSFHPAPWYISADLGYNIRSKGFSHDVFYNIEAGYGLMDQRLYVILLISGRQSTSSKPTIPTQASLFGLNTQNQEFNAIIPKLFYRTGGGWGVSLSWATATQGRNVAGGFVFAGGVSYEF